jgi:two-component system nitrate/nitrite sensor histidine kinase NarX
MSANNNINIPLKELEKTLPSQAKKSQKLPARVTIRFPWQAKLALSILFFIFVFIGASYFWAVSRVDSASWIPYLMTALWLIAGAGLLGLFYWIGREFIQFGDDLSNWAMQMRKNQLDTRMPIPTSPLCTSRLLRERINNISEDYQSLSEKQQKRLLQQREHIEKKKHYLNVLYDVASCINDSQNLEDLLQRFLHTLRDVVNAEAATVRLLDQDGQMRLVASIGLSQDIIDKEDILPVDVCMCGKAVLGDEIKARTDIKKCGKIFSQQFSNNDQIELLAIPLRYRGKTLGVYNLFVKGESKQLLKEEQELLSSIGQHLGMAIEKSSVDEEARMLSIIEERTRMAHELHDSLAQTLASLRYQIRLFDDSLLNRGDDATIWQELEKLEENIDLAYAELRSLITHFRAPVDGKGIVHVVERLVERFKRDTDFEVFYYHNWSLEHLNRDIEIEAVRIVQEALANIRKHSQAKTVRILLYSSEDGKCSILIEDDGIGLAEDRPTPNKETGEHIGLHVMQERAQRINGEIQFESEVGEGTLVQLTFEVKVP